METIALSCPIKMRGLGNEPGRPTGSPVSDRIKVHEGLEIISVEPGKSKATVLGEGQERKRPVSQAGKQPMEMQDILGVLGPASSFSACDDSISTLTSRWLHNHCYLRNGNNDTYLMELGKEHMK